MKASVRTVNDPVNNELLDDKFIEMFITTQISAAGWVNMFR